MARSPAEDQVLRWRMHSQRLAGGRLADVAGVVHSMAAVQAQSTRDARLAVRPRADGVDTGAVRSACNQARSVVRTWAMRATLHMLAAPDVGWIVDLYRPPPGAVSTRQRQLGLDEELLARAMPAIAEVLSERGPLTRTAMVAELARAGVGVNPVGQAPAHLVSYAARQGLICRAADLDDDEPTYALLASWVGEREPAAPGRSVAELARRFIRSRGPVGPHDFGYWSGLPLGAARRGFEQVASEFAKVDVAGEAAWLDPELDRASPEIAEPCVRLVPHFDEYLLSYRSRLLALPAGFATRIQAGGGWIRAAVVADGRVVGTWAQAWRRREITVSVTPFGRLDPVLLPGLEAEAADLGRFQGVPASLQVAGDP